MTPRELPESFDSLRAKLLFAIETMLDVAKSIEGISVEIRRSYPERLTEIQPLLTRLGEGQTE